MTKPLAPATKSTPRGSEPSKVEASETSKKKVRAIAKQDADATRARERARQRAGADD